jgi:hypothetical protein|tara:strand:+ start:402 stop:611 length:210 start_codon:yes stop_codon:yes gene_type:complete
MKIKEGDLVLSTWLPPEGVPRLQGVVTEIVPAPNEVSDVFSVAKVFWINANEPNICEYFESELELVAKS